MSISTTMNEWVSLGMPRAWSSTGRALAQMTRGRFVWLVTLAALPLVFGACAGYQQAEPKADLVAACNVNLCNISQDTWENHIEPRHCQGSCPPKSIFVNAYCGSLDNAIAFCKAVMNSLNCAGAQQPNGRVAYTATLTSDVGNDRNNSCKQTKTGTVIHDPRTAAVVTQFPGNP